MEFKIDTNENYARIAPIGANLNVNMAALLEEHATQLAESGVPNFMIVLSACQTGEDSAYESLVNWHTQCYSEGRSLVFTELQDDVKKQMRAAGVDEALNIAPTEIEAIDIINMEILERDLFNEES
jgi:anti-anti-sigma regulatory factor